MNSIIIFRFRALMAAAVVCFLLESCGNENKQETKTDNNSITAPSKSPGLPPSGSLDGDTVNIHGKYVLFFTVRSNEQTPPDQVKMFAERSKLLIDSLARATGIQGAYSDASFIRIYGKNNAPMILTARSLNTGEGVLVTDGSQPPKILKGILTDSAYHKLFADYFFLDLPKK